MERWTILRRAAAVLAAVAFLWGMAAPSRAASGPRRWALVIGIDRYDKSDVTPLQDASADARLLVATLQQACGYPADHVIEMTSDSPGANRPTTANILQALQLLKSRVQPGDEFLFYFNGHGVSVGNAAYLLTIESTTSSESAIEQSGLSVAKLQDAIRGIPASRVLQVVDASRNDPHGGRATGDNPLTHAMSRDLELVGATPDVTAPAREHFTLETAATLFACKVGERSYEGLDGHGYFTYYLVKGLEGGAATPQGTVTLASLMGYLDQQVPQAVRVREEGKVQEPWADIQGSSGSDWVLAHPTGRQVVDNSHTTVAAGPSGPPRIMVSYPAPGFATQDARVTLLGTVVSGQMPSKVTVALNGRDLGASGVTVTPHGAEISVPLDLKYGKNQVALHAEAGGQAVDQALEVTRNRPPEAPPQDVSGDFAASVNTNFQHADQHDVKIADVPPPRRHTTPPATPPPSAPPAPREAPGDGQVKLQVRASVPGALVFIDGELKGYVPFTTGLAPGFHEVRVSSPGMVPVIQSVTLQAGHDAEIDADLQPGAGALCDQAAAALKKNDTDSAARLLAQATAARGEHPARLLFYQGWLAEYQNRMEDAEAALVHFVNQKPDSATAYYLLGKARESLGKTRLAVTAYKHALLILVTGARSLLNEAGAASAENQARLETAAQGGNYASMLQLGWIYEERGQEQKAGTAFRNLFELLAAGHQIDTRDPSPKGVPISLAAP